MERGGDVGVDISLEGWQGALIAKGVDSKKPPVWLLEGLTVYLTETELLALLGVISHLSAASSRLAATWLAPGGVSHGEQHALLRAITRTFLRRFAGRKCRCRRCSSCELSPR